LQRTDSAGLYTGVYDSYAAAEQDIPASLNRGWDNQQSAAIWVRKIDHIQPTAYAPFFWLSNLVRAGTVLLDYGGSIGLSFYSYVRRRQLPERARWIIIELPHLAAIGKSVALAQSAAQLEFVTDLTSTPSCDILFSAGALQYMEDSVPGILEKFPVRPPHILLNKVPLTRGKSYWTLQNFGTAVSPYRVYAEKEFIGYFENAGYRLRDRWGVPELSCDVPFHPQCFVPEFSGLYFQKCEAA
jgi:putative methyltransferase (TIGR04325 family)